MRLAERASVSWLLGAAAIGTLALVAPQLAADEPPPPPPRGCVVVALELPPIASSCPPAVRAALHVDADASAVCLRDERGYFVFAYYFTTEWWERIGVVSYDGSRVLVPLVDRPALPMWRDGDVVTHAIIHGVAVRDTVTLADMHHIEAFPIRNDEIGFMRVRSSPGYMDSPSDVQARETYQVRGGRFVRTE
jgi:hypothetical protein